MGSEDRCVSGEWRVSRYHRFTSGEIGLTADNNWIVCEVAEALLDVVAKRGCPAGNEPWASTHGQSPELCLNFLAT